MTREEAIAVLKGYIENPLVNDTKAFEMAIQALSQEPCDDAVSRKDAEQMFRNIRSHLKPQDYKSAEEFNTRDLMLLNAEQMIHALPSVTPKSIVCDDAISRQAVLDLINADWKYEGLEEPVSSLPPVTQKSGKWSHDGSHWKNRFICSECNYKLFDEPTNYCPNCGAKMVEPQESECDA